MFDALHSVQETKIGATTVKSFLDNVAWVVLNRECHVSFL